MLRLGRLCASPLLRNELALARNWNLGAEAGRCLASTSASTSVGRTKRPPPPPPSKKKKGPALSAPSLTPRPVVEKEPHEPKQHKHGLLTRKARAPPPKRWVKPPPRRPHARTVNRARLRRRRLPALLADPRARVPRIRLGFHALRNARPLRRGRRGRLAPWVRAKLAEAGELQSRRNRTRRGRPDISLKRPRRWNSPLPEGILPAYDEALRVIRADAKKVRREAAKQRKEVARAHDLLVGEAEGGVKLVDGEKRKTLEAELEKMRAKLDILDVQSEVNLPEVRWSVANAMGGSLSFQIILTLFPH